MSEYTDALWNEVDKLLQKLSTGRFKAIDSIRRQARFTSTETMAEPVGRLPMTR